MRFHFLNWRSLKSRVTVFTVAIFLISVWSLAFYSSWVLRGEMQRQLGAQQFSTVSLMAEQINSELTDRINALQRVAGEITPGVLEQPSVLQAHLEERLFFQNLFNGGVSAVRADGMVIADFPYFLKRVGLNYLDRDYLLGALHEGKTMIGRPVIDKVLLTPTFSIAVPIFDLQNKVIGALFGVVNLGKPSFLDKIPASHYGKTGGYLLIAPQHKLFVTATDKTRIMQPIPAKGVNPLFDSYIEGHEGYGVSVSSRGIEELTAVKGIAVAGWYLGLVIHTQEAFAPIRIMQQRLLVVTLALTLLTGAMVWWLMSWMLRRQFSPMLAAERALTTLSDSGHPNPSLPVTSQDEIGELISGFNRLLKTLGQREALLKQILDTSSVAIFLVDLDGRIAQANQRMAEMFNCPLATLQGSDYTALLHPTEHESVHKNMLDILDGSVESIEVDRIYYRSDNTEFWGHMSGKRFYDAEGEEHGLIGVITDITERKQFEEKLHLNASVFTHAQEGIVLTDVDGLIIDVNSAFTRITGYSREDVVGRNARLLHSGRHDSAFYNAMWRDLLDKGLWSGEIWNRRKSGEIYPEMLTISALRDAQGITRRYMAMFSDITQRKQMEEQVHQLAFYDALTGLPNRRLLEDRLKQVMVSSKRSGLYGALMFLDLDNFKPLNDAQGHAVGDLLLVEVASRLSACLREADTVARFGGDEFVVMLGELTRDEVSSTEQALYVAEKIRASVAAPYYLAVMREGQEETIVEHRCSVSIGMVMFINHSASLAEILKWADMAMYQAKDAGRNLVRMYEEK